MDKQKKISSIKLGELINKLRTDKMKKSKTFEEKKKYGLRGFAERITVINNKGIKKKMSHANLSHIENGDVWTTKDILKQIADNLEYPFDKILAIRNEIADNYMVEGQLRGQVGRNIKKYFRESPITTFLIYFLRKPQS